MNKKNIYALKWKKTYFVEEVFLNANEIDEYVIKLDRDETAFYDHKQLQKFIKDNSIEIFEKNLKTTPEKIRIEK